jgi:arginase
MRAMKKLHIVSAGTSEGSVNHGCETAPEVLLQSGLHERLVQDAWKIKLSNIAAVAEDNNYDDLGLRNAASLIPWLQELYRQLVLNTSYDEKALVLGGDHSIGAVSLLATKQQYPDAVCVYVDAHPDAHSLESSQTRNIHGLPLRIAAGQTLAKYFPGPYYAPSEIYLVGIKDIDPAEARWLEEQKISHATMDTILEQGIGTVMHRVSEWVGDRPLHVSYDIDAIDAAFAPGTGILNAGGLNYREAEYLARKLGTLNPVAVDMVEVNPLRDEAGKTVRLAQELIVKLLGGEWNSYQDYLHSEVQ